MRKVQSNAALANTNIIGFVGDSQTEFLSAATFGVAPYRAHPGLLMARLRKIGCNVKSKVTAISGSTCISTTSQARLLFEMGTPNIVVIYVGVNDPYSNNAGNAVAGTANTITLAASAFSGNSAYIGQQITITSGPASGDVRTIIAYSGQTKVATVNAAWSATPTASSAYTIPAATQAQTQSNLQALIKIFKYGARGNIRDTVVTVWSQTQLPANSTEGTRYIVLNDTSNNGGCAANNPNYNPTITADYSASPKQTVWEYRNCRGGTSGWGRVAITGTPIFADGIQKIMVVSTNYLNHPTGGDNYNTNTNTGTQFADYVPIRAAQKAASIAEGTLYCDLYDFQSKLINGGMFQGLTLISETAQGSDEFHYKALNQHHGSYGNETVERAIFQTIINNNWIDTLKS